MNIYEQVPMLTLGNVPTTIVEVLKVNTTICTMITGDLSQMVACQVTSNLMNR